MESSSPDGTTKGFPVYLSVYERVRLINKSLSAVGLGLYHTAVQVHGVEYAFGTHAKNTTGIYPSQPEKDDLVPEGYIFRESILIGHTDYAKEDVRRVITELGYRFPGNGYDRITKNCNTFSSEFVKILCNKDVPYWINRPARLAGMVPFSDKVITGSSRIVNGCSRIFSGVWIGRTSKPQ